MDQKLQQASQWSFQNVFGWVGHRIPQILDFVQQYHESEGIRGDVCEIGIHHGKLFFMIAALAREDEKCIAIDLFDHQELNVDKSGGGSLEIFQKHLSEGYPDLVERTRIIGRDSMSITPTSIRSELGTQNIRLMSVDGGHTVAHAVNDLCLAQEILTPGGIVLLDDFFGIGWPGVTEGYFSYMANRNQRLRPFLIFQNKLFLTTFSEQHIVLQRLRAYLDAVVGDEIHKKWKYVELSATQVLAYYGT